MVLSSGRLGALLGRLEALLDVLQPPFSKFWDDYRGLFGDLGRPDQRRIEHPQIMKQNREKVQNGAGRP